MEQGTTMKILVVEDDKDFLWILRQSLEDGGLAVVFAENGEDGLSLAEKEKPDLIVIDIMLPGMDGITMARKIKEKGVLSQMIFLTNIKDPREISRALEAAGESDYIVKSDVRVDAIVERIKNKLGLTSGK